MSPSIKRYMINYKWLQYELATTQDEYNELVKEGFHWVTEECYVKFIEFVKMYEDDEV